MRYKNEIFNKYLSKYNIPKTIILPLLQSKKLTKDIIYPETISKIAFSIQRGIPYKKIINFISMISNPNKFRILKWEDQILSKTILIQEKDYLMDPFSKQYFIDFSQIRPTTKIYKITHIWKIINDYYHQRKFDKVYELTSKLICSKNFMNEFSEQKKFFLREIYGEAVLTLFPEKHAISTFKKLIKDYEEVYFYKFIAWILLIRKHYKFSFIFFNQYYIFIQQKHSKEDFSTELLNTKFILDQLKILCSKNYQTSLKLLKKSEKKDEFSRR